MHTQRFTVLTVVAKQSEHLTRSGAQVWHAVCYAELNYDPPSPLARGGDRAQESSILKRTK